MRLGLVKHINARPLTYGLEIEKKHTLIYDNPSLLKDMLLAGKLDAALISSVECLRNQKQLAFSTTTGVCAKERVRSILFYHNRREDYPPEKIYVDSGSRTSVALLKVLLQMSIGKIPPTISQDPSYIMSMLSKGHGFHMLFGDNALLAKYSLHNFYVYDLAHWWYRETGKGFCFAFWAYPKENPIPDSFFEQSLQVGLKYMDKILRREKRLPKDLLERYLTQELHYYLKPEDWQGFLEFENLCQQNQLI